MHRRAPERGARSPPRKHLGAVPAICWTDHKHLIADVIAPTACPLTIRWVGDIEGSGDRLKNLSGRMATVADGLSREPWDLFAKLLDRKKSIRDFRVEDVLHALETDGMQPSALPGQSAPTHPGGSYADISPGLRYTAISFELR